MGPVVVRLAAVLAKDHVEKICRNAPGGHIFLKNVERGKYFRLLADVWCDGKKCWTRAFECRVGYSIC